jgi:dTDP-4-dehydrorhamnose reductase
MGGRLAFRIFLTEGESALAQALLKELEQYTFAVAVTSEEADLAGNEPGVVINTCAFAGMLPARFNPAAIHLPLIHVSSQEVFAGSQSPSGFFEQELPAAATERAANLLAAEHWSQQGKAIVLRLPLLLDLYRGNWFEAFLTRLCRDAWVSVSEVARLDPVSTKEACRVIIALVQQIGCGAENWGVMHLRTAEPCSEAEFADHLVRQLKKEQWPMAQLDVVKTPSIWIEPVSVLAGRRLTDTFGVQMRSWRLGVKGFMQQWMDEHRPVAVLPEQPSVAE